MKAPFYIALLGLGLAAACAPRAAPFEVAPASAVPFAVPPEQAADAALGRRASELIGAAVVDERNRRIGTIADLVVGPGERVAYAVVATGGFLGIGDRTVAVPFERFKVAGAERLMLPGATPAALAELPPYRLVPPDPAGARRAAPPATP